MKSTRQTQLEEEQIFQTAKDIYILLLKDVHPYDENGTITAAELAIAQAKIFIEKLNTPKPIK